MEDPEDIEVYEYISNSSNEIKVTGQPFLQPFSSKVSSLDNVMVKLSIIETIQREKTYSSNNMLYGMSSLNYKKYIEKELLTGWLFSGKKQMACSCFPSTSIPVGDLASGVISWTYHTRSLYCRLAAKELDSLDLCSLLHASEVTHLLWDRDTMSSIDTAFWQNFSTKIWSSSKEKYQFYIIDPKKAKNLACSPNIETVDPEYQPALSEPGLDG